MFQKILFCSDLSENSDCAFPYALSLARTYSAKLLIFHVDVERTYYFWASPQALDESGSKHISSAVHSLKSRYAVKLGEFQNFRYLATESGEGEVSRKIIETVLNEKVDLIVMGTHGRTGLSHLLLGSTAEDTVKNSPCPVLTIRMPQTGNSKGS
jgi:nucleotide-binding universal stress UspA family protein